MGESIVDLVVGGAGLTALGPAWVAKWLLGKPREAVYKAITDNDDHVFDKLFAAIESWSKDVSKFYEDKGVAVNPALFARILVGDKDGEACSRLHQDLLDCLSNNEIPDESLWHMVLLDRWRAVSDEELLYAGHDLSFFKLEAMDAERHLFQLARSLRTVCVQDSNHFQQFVVDGVGEIKARLKETHGDVLQIRKEFKPFVRKFKEKEKFEQNERDRCKQALNAALMEMASWKDRHVFALDDRDWGKGDFYLPLEGIYVEPDAGIPNRIGRVEESFGVLSVIRDHLDAQPGKIGVFVAGFGHGKSLTARTLACTRARDVIENFNHEIPIFIKCDKNFAAPTSDDAFQSIVAKALDKLSNYVFLEGEAREYLKDRNLKLLLIFDGLDEVTLNDGDCETFFETAHRVMKRSDGKIRCLVFSRPAAVPNTEEIKKCTARYLIEPFDNEKVGTWLEKWQGLFPDKTDLSAKRLQERNLQGEVQIPVFLSMTALAWEKFGHADFGEADLYEEYLWHVAKGKYQGDRNGQHRCIHGASEKIKDQLESLGILCEKYRSFFGGCRGGGTEDDCVDAMFWILSRIAWEAHIFQQSEKSNAQLKEQHIKKILTEELGIKESDVHSVYLGIVLALQFDVGNRHSRILFGHRSFQGYLVARFWAYRVLLILDAEDTAEQNDLEKVLFETRHRILPRLHLKEDRSVHFLRILLGKNEKAEKWLSRREDIQRWSARVLSSNEKKHRCFQESVFVFLNQVVGTLSLEEQVFFRRLMARFKAEDECGRFGFEACHLEGINLEGIDLKEVSFVGANLKGANFEGADLTEVYLARANLREANFAGANLREAHLEGADLTKAHFEGTNLEGTLFEGSDLTKAHFTGLDLTEAHFEGATLKGTDFEDANLTEADLKGADLAGANLIRADLTKADLEGADLTGADLTGACFEGANLGGTKLEGAKLTGACFEKARLEGADLTRANFKGVNFEGASLEGADLEGTHLTGANFEGTRLAGVYLTRAKLEESELVGSDLLEAILSQANLAGAKLFGANLAGANLTGAKLEGTKFIEAELQEADLRGANLTGADLTEAKLQEADLRGANLTGADLTEAELQEADLRGADLTGADLTEAELQETDLRGADLTGIDLTEANLRRADLRGANLAEARLKEADLRGTDFERANLEHANFVEAKYNQHTQFPEDFDPQEHGMNNLDDPN